MSIELEFERWIAHLRRLRLPVADMLLPGLNCRYIRNEIFNVGLNCRDDLIELYSVCGGVSARRGVLLNDMWMYGSHYMLPFDRAIENYKIFSRDSRWNAAWFPILGNDGGDFYSICSLIDRDDWGHISYFMINAGDDAQIRFSSILNMLIAINECFDRGICFIDDQGNLATNFFEASIVAMNHNKELSFYQ